MERNALKQVLSIIMIAVIFITTWVSYIPAKAAETEGETQPGSELVTETQNESETMGETDAESQAPDESETIVESVMESTEEMEVETEKNKNRGGMSKAVGATSGYLALKTEPKALSTGATIKEIGSALPNGYTGFFVKKSSGYSLSKSVSYDSGVTYDMSGTAIAGYDMDSKDKYNDGGSKEDGLYATYPKAYKYEGVYYDVKVILHDWKISGGSSGKGTNSAGEDIPVVSFRTDFPGVYVSRIDSIELYHEIYEHGTTNKVSSKGYVTFCDIDWGQGVVLKGGSWETVYASSDAKTNLGYQVTSSDYPYYFAKKDDFSSSTNDPDSQISVLFSGSSLKCTYTFCRAKGTDSEGTEGFFSQKLFKGPSTITKRVSDSDEKLATSNTLKSVGEDYSYIYYVDVPDESSYTHYNDFVIRDMFESVIQVDTTKITVTDSSGSNVKNRFDVALSGQKLTLTATDAALSSGSFYAERYTVTVPVSIKKGANLLPYWNAGNNRWEIPDTVYLDYDNGTVTSNRVWTYTYKKIEVGDVRINKIDSRTKAAITAGVTFNVYEWNGAAYSAAVYDTLKYDAALKQYYNANTYLKTNANKGKFLIKETVNPDAYKIPTWQTEVTISDMAEIQTFTYTVENVPVFGSVTIEKLDEETKTNINQYTKELLSDAVFTLYKKEPSGYVEQGKVTWNATEKKYIAKELPVGEYKVVETGVPAYYRTDEKPWSETFTVSKHNDNNDYSYKVTNTLISGSFEVEKLGSAGLAALLGLPEKDLSDVEFTLTHEHGDWKHIIVTDKDGYAKVDGVKYGKWTVSETKGHLEYFKMTGPVTFEITKEGQLVSFTNDKVINNTLMEPDVAVTKLASRTTFDSEGKKVAGFYKRGIEVPYTIVVTNTGNTLLQEVEVIDTVSGELKELIVADSEKFTVDSTIKSVKAKTVNVTMQSPTHIVLDRIEKGDAVELTFVVTLKEDAEYLGLLGNEVKVRAKYPNDPDDPEALEKVPNEPEDNDDIQIITPLVAIAKLADRTTEAVLNKESGRYEGEKITAVYGQGGKVTYTITVTNTGNVKLYNLNMIDMLEERLADLSHDSGFVFSIKDGDTIITEDGVKIDIGSVHDQVVGDAVTMPFLNVADSFTLTYVTTINETAKYNRELDNVATVSGEHQEDQPEGVDENAPKVPIPEKPEMTDNDKIKIQGPALVISKLADRTTEAGELVSGKYTGEKVNGEYQAGEQISYLITATNTGNVTAHNVVITDKMERALRDLIVDGKGYYTLPDGTVIENGASIKATTTNGKEVSIAVKGFTAAFDMLEGGDSLALNYVVTLNTNVKLAKDLENEVTINGEYIPNEKYPEERQPIPEDRDVDEVDIFNEEARISVSKLADRTGGVTFNTKTGRYEGAKEAGTYTANDVISYKITAKNTGNVDAFNVLIKDTISDTLKKHAKSAYFDVSARTLKTAAKKDVNITVKSDTAIVVEKLEAGDMIELVFIVELKPSVTAETAVSNTVKVTGDNISEDEDDEDTDEVEIIVPSLAISKLADKTSGVELNKDTGRYEGSKINGVYIDGDVISYKITVKNTSEVAATNVHVEDSIGTKLQKYSKRAYFDLQSGEINTENGGKAKITVASDTAFEIERLEANDMVTVFFIVELKDAVKEAEGLENSVKVTGNNVPEDEDDKDTDEVDLKVPSIVVAKLADKTSGATLNADTGRYEGTKTTGTYEPGKEVSWTITVTNTGAKEVNSITVVDKLSAELASDLDSAAFIYKDGQTIKTAKGKKALIKVKGDLSIELDRLEAGDSITLKVLGKLKNNVKKYDTAMVNTVTITANSDGKAIEKSAAHTDQDAILIKNPTEKSKKESGNPVGIASSATSASASDGGKGSGFTSSVKTGDNTPLMVLILMLAVSAASIGLLFYKKKLKK